MTKLLYACSSCDQAYTLCSSLRSHVYRKHRQAASPQMSAKLATVACMHAKRKRCPQKCLHCGRLVLWKENLAKHELLCARGTRRRRAPNAAPARAPAQTEDSGNSQDSTIYTCTICGKTFAKLSCLETHRSRNHRHPQHLKCRSCGRSFASHCRRSKHECYCLGIQVQRTHQEREVALLARQVLDRQEEKEIKQARKLAASKGEAVINFSRLATLSEALLEPPSPSHQSTCALKSFLRAAERAAEHESK